MIRRHDSIVVQKISRLLIPFIQLFGLYVLFHGHHSPGGGFQGGVLIGASMVLLMLIGTQRKLKGLSIHQEFLLATAGLGIFVGIGSLALLYGGELFNYETIALLGHLKPYRRYLGILIAETGVLLIVSMTIILIAKTLAFPPEEQEKRKC